MNTSGSAAVIACGLLALISFARAQDASSPIPGPQLSPGAKYLLSRVQPGVTRERFIQNLNNDFLQFDADANGEISAADGEAHTLMYASNWRGTLMMQIMRADLNDDDAVTEDELRRQLRYDRRNMAQRAAGLAGDDPIEREVRRLMAADADSDGRITVAEALSHSKKRAEDVQGRSVASALNERLNQMLALAPAGQSTVARTAAEEAAATFFTAVDTDKNNTITAEEIASYRKSIGAPTAAEEERERSRQQAEKAQAQRDAELRAACSMPKASVNARVLLLSAYHPDAISTTTIGLQDVVTHAGSIAVEAGDEPLYVVIATHSPTIWRFTGAVERIEQVVVASSTTGPNSGKPDEISLAGATGVPVERVGFLKAKCLSYFSETPSTQAARATGFVRNQVSKAPELVSARYQVSGFAVPSGEIRTTGRADRPMLVIQKSAGTLTIQGGANVVVQAGASDLARDVANYFPGGIVEIDPATVVASQPAKRYEVLPSQAGLLQLVQNGALARNKGGEFLIKQKIRFPAGLYGAHSVKFLLLRGVPEPDGDPGHSCVIVEETGESLKSSTSASCR